MNTMDHSKNSISYLTLRRLIGIVAILHPLILLIGGLVIFGLPLQPSMSDYYWTGMRDVFVGIDFATGVFFLCYLGYSWHDRAVAMVAGISAISVALFPTAPIGDVLTDSQVWIAKVHAVFAISFLLAIAYFCLVLFVKHDPEHALSAKKKLRNRMYRTCGVIILLVVVAIGVFMAVPSVHESFSKHAFIYWMEVAAFWAFGFAWLVKGEALLKG